eukprot:2534293-Pyramimonas_sp.AAC.1
MARGHDIRIAHGYRVCLKCCFFVREREGLVRDLGKDCTGHPRKGDNAGRVRQQRRDLILLGKDPKSRKPILPS